MELTKNVYVSKTEKINPARGHHSGRNLFQLIFSSLMNFRKDNVERDKFKEKIAFAIQNSPLKIIPGGCVALQAHSSLPQCWFLVDGQFVLLRFRQLHRPVADVKLQLVSHILRGQTNASKPNLNAADYFCLCFSFTFVLSHFYQLSFSHFPRCYSRRPEFMWWMREASTLLKRSRLRFHSCWINICAATKYESSAIASFLSRCPAK